jgi:hypothetical protein
LRHRKELQRNALGGSAGMDIEHVGGKPPIHLEPVGCADALIEPQRGDAQHLGERGLFFGGGVVAEPAVELAQDGIAAVTPDTDDERDAEFLAVLVVQFVKARVFIFR